jgi:hypothetical protein
VAEGCGWGSCGQGHELLLVSHFEAWAYWLAG